ncbi:glycosyltransferase family 2 protein [Herbiconiux sp.]|uniref:glycosyltransferase family 2 protein n=1 Tax=Herbiconiux sp. TaxID=1871186 RepID=UPI0025C03627|nr:glycosyltransferase family 2 protein [Herbiconiux sp.]
MTPALFPHESHPPAASVGSGSKPTRHGRSVPGNAWDLLDGVQPDTPPRVSVVVVHYDQQRELNRTLRALARQTLPALEVIVVDDGSPSAPRVPEGVRLLVLPDRGFRAAAARNAGAAAASGDVLCFLDADTAPEPEYLERLSRLPALCPEAVTVGRRRHAAFDDAEAEAGTGAADPVEPVEVAGPRTELPEPAWLRNAYAASRDLLDADQHSYRFMIGAVLACSRGFFGETGGFDERFDRYGGEDWEWAHRAWTEGAVFAHVPEAVAWHDGPDLAGRARGRDDLLRRKNAEALVLFDRIGLRGNGGATPGLRSAALDVVAELPPGAVAATFVCTDVLLEALPGARVVVDDDLAAALPADERIVARSRGVALLAAARTTIVVDALFTVPREHRGAFGTTLRSAVEQIGVGTLGWIELTAQHQVTEPAALAHGTPAPAQVLRLGAHRAERRRERHPADHGFRTEPLTAPMRVLDSEPDLEAHLAGWAG